MIHTLASRPAALVTVAVGIAAAAAGVAGLTFASGAGPVTQAAIGANSPAASTAPQDGAAGKVGAIPAPTLYDLRQQAAAHRPPPPVALAIPAIGVNTRLVHLDLTPAGALQVPADPTVAGWYTRSPRPGAIGSSVIIGHVDSTSGPAVFFRLSHVRRGTRVYVRQAGGGLATFRVDAVRAYDKDRFPTAGVYGPTPDPELRLVTCGGIFDQTLKSYLSNVVVYATAVS